MIAGTPYFKAVSMRITRYALAKTVPQLDYARAELDKQRRDAGYHSLGLVAVTAGGMIGNMKIRSGGTADRAMREGSVDGAVTALLLLSRRSNRLGSRRLPRGRSLYDLRLQWNFNDPPMGVVVASLKDASDAQKLGE
ncbi:hypothetical protein E4U35_005442 [Claviceps purpurea]|nr:hypothetical protein E4U35_005442 [Claviceps purpurea]KAG6268647.1 hypothetical protein E4U49_007140 [Claviceps purpurea]